MTEITTSTTYPHTCEFTLGGGDDPLVTIIMTIDENGKVHCVISQDADHPITGDIMGFFVEFPDGVDYISSGLTENTNGTQNVNMQGSPPSNEGTEGTWDGFRLIDDNGGGEPNYEGPIEFDFYLTGNWQEIDWSSVEAGIRMQSVNNAAGSVNLFYS